MRKILFALCLGLLVAGVSSRSAAASSGIMTALSGHVPAVVKTLTATGRVAATNTLHLSIGLPLRNRDLLTNLLQQIYDPSSQNYHHFLTPAEFTSQFGPTPKDYQAVLDFAASNHFTVTRTHENRMLVEVNGKASDVEHAFFITLRTYQDPKGNRQFFAPDTEPAVDVSLPVLSIQGMNNYVQPHPMLQKRPASKVSPAIGSGPGGGYMGSDFRAAYVPGAALNGSGQVVGLLQFDGYLASDIATYESIAGLTNVPLQNVLLDGFDGSAGVNNDEVCLDIETSISMAPALSEVVVFEAGPFGNPNDILSSMAASNSIKQFSASWGYSVDGTTEQLYQQLALQGQTFLNASGDSDAWVGQIPFGSVEDPNITIVGGTTLTTTGPGGSRVSETVWNWGNEFGIDGVGSSGGISTDYSIPSWQQGISMTSNHGSLSQRNLPDVALTADNVFVVSSGGSQGIFGGTSCAAPLWAGFMALVNQQAVINSKPSVGFLAPQVYALAKNGSYASCFFDIISGDNTWSQSPANFFAVSGYDLCTGLGTPNGTNMINALANGPVSAGPVVSAPPQPYGTVFSIMNGTDPNGPWFLFVQDDSPGDIGNIANGWLLNLTTADPVGASADVGISMTATPPASVAISNNVTFVVSVTNYGPSSATNVIVNDTLPSGAALVSTNATTGASSFVITNSVLTWNIGNLITNAGAQLTIVAETFSGSYITNSAFVITNSTDPNPDDNTASAFVNIASAQAAHLSGGSIVNGAFQLTVTGTTSGVSYIVQATTNLANSASWANIYTTPPPFTSSFIFTNLDSSNFPARFYRVISGP